ncbi:hypothetical protein SDC9_109693 [bioreactor metagenome]|uniref:Uncharacterized protein n=1 Tax=bioreactor metagenome TaxID=1076179 RepID=A0A645BBI8_9ZZZZ
MGSDERIVGIGIITITPGRPGSIGEGSDSTICRSCIHIEMADAVIITGDHGTRNCRASEYPGIGGNVRKLLGRGREGLNFFDGGRIFRFGGGVDHRNCQTLAVCCGQCALGIIRADDCGGLPRNFSRGCGSIRRISTVILSVYSSAGDAQAGEDKSQHHKPGKYNFHFACRI